MALSVIDQGKKLFTKRKYNEVISTLEPHVLDYRDSFTFHFYLGLACLYSGEIPGAKDYFSRARQIKPTDPDLLAAEAAMFLRRCDTANAIQYYMLALNYNPNYKLAKKGLTVIRKNNSPEEIGNLVQSGEIKKLYPNPGSEEKKGKIIAASLITLIAVISISIIIPYFYKTRTFIGDKRTDMEPFKLNSYERKHAVDMEGTFHYILTESQILSAYHAAQSYFNEHRDNAAQVEINRILSSNASFSIKQKAGLLMEYLEEPGFDTIKDIYEFSQVKKEPLLYLDCWVTWKGMPTNIQSGAHSTVFNLLVGYDTRQQLEGVVTVSCEFVSTIDADRPITVLGQVKIKDGSICLKGKGIHQSQKPAEND